MGVSDRPLFPSGSMAQDGGFTGRQFGTHRAMFPKRRLFCHRHAVPLPAHATDSSTPSRIQPVRSRPKYRTPATSSGRTGIRPERVLEGAVGKTEAKADSPEEANRNGRTGAGAQPVDPCRRAQISPADRHQHAVQEKLTLPRIARLASKVVENLLPLLAPQSLLQLRREYKAKYSR